MLAYTYVRQGEFLLLDKQKPILQDSRDTRSSVWTIASICTSDLHIKHGAVPRARPGITVGHEMVGCSRVGGRRGSAFRPGDRVAVNVETFLRPVFFLPEWLVNNVRTRAAAGP